MGRPGYARAMRHLVAALFAVAVGCTILAGDGLVLVPHTHAPGTPAEHPHGLGLYRFPIALLGSPPGIAAIAGPRDGRPQLRSGDPYGQTFVGASLLLTVGVIFLMAVPAAALASRVTLPILAPPQWKPVAIPGPPRKLPGP